MKPLNRVRISATPGTATYEAPLSIGFSRQEYWSGLPLPSPVCTTRIVKIIETESRMALSRWESHFLGRLIRSLGVPKERGVWNSQGGRKDKLFFPSLHSLGLYNNNVSCLRTVSGLNLLANSVILKWSRSGEVLTTFGFIGEYITSLLTLTRGYSFCPLLMPMSEAFSISFIL